jgi:hypothetical protein
MEQTKNDPELTEHLQRSELTIALRILLALFMIDIVYSF